MAGPSQARPEKLGIQLSFFCYDVEFNVGEDALVAFNLGLELSELFDLGDLDVLFVYLEAEFCKGCRYLGGGNGAIELAALANLYSHVEGLCGELGCLGLGLGDVLGFFVSPLTDGLLVLLESGRGADGGESLGNEVIESVSGLDFYDLTGIAEIGHIFLKYDLHNASII